MNQPSMLQNILSMIDQFNQNQPAEPDFSGVIRESLLLTKTRVVVRDRLKLKRVGKRKKWFKCGGVVSFCETIPDDTIYKLPDGSIVCHPVVKRRIEDAMSSIGMPKPPITTTPTSFFRMWPMGSGFGGSLDIGKIY